MTGIYANLTINYCHNFMGILDNKTLVNVIIPLYNDENSVNRRNNKIELAEGHNNEYPGEKF
ncbi:hypothetical protein GCM10008986_10680 [Salinibacillus aidingensis]|uniref:Uncharacterized protein n=1 Tax=Salinibacillus aidingensis TaxID=237684 RepID=A0ABP3KXL7_9BACI